MHLLRHFRADGQDEGRKGDHEGKPKGLHGTLLDVDAPAGCLSKSEVYEIHLK